MSSEGYDAKVKSYFTDNYPRINDSTIQMLIENTIPNWYLNKIVGYVIITKETRSFLATLYWTDKKRITWNSNGKGTIRFYERTLFDVHVDKCDTHDAIMDKFKNEFDTACNQHPLKGRFIDTGPFFTMCRYVNWNSVFYPPL